MGEPFYQWFCLLHVSPHYSAVLSRDLTGMRHEPINCHLSFMNLVNSRNDICFDQSFVDSMHLPKGLTRLCFSRRLSQKLKHARTME